MDSAKCVGPAWKLSKWRQGDARSWRAAGNFADHEAASGRPNETKSWPADCGVHNPRSDAAHARPRRPPPPRYRRNFHGNRPRWAPPIASPIKHRTPGQSRYLRMLSRGSHRQRRNNLASLTPTTRGSQTSKDPRSGPSCASVRPRVKTTRCDKSCLPRTRSQVPSPTRWDVVTVRRTGSTTRRRASPDRHECDPPPAAGHARPACPSRSPRARQAVNTATGPSLHAPTPGSTRMPCRAVRHRPACALASSMVARKTEN